MKKVFVIIVLCLLSSLCSPSYAANDDYYRAQRFAQEYEHELRAKSELIEAKWNVSADLKAGVANYEEKESTLKSSFKAFYPELALSAINKSDNDIETALRLSYGQSVTDKEKWKLSGIEYQTNDLYFQRLNLKASVGKILYSDLRDFKATPFLGYGFRFVNFSRTNFNVLNIITSRDIVTEKYYVHHIDVGLGFEKQLTDQFNISGLGAYGYVFYNKAQNSALGGIRGSGGYIAEANLEVGYTLSEAWKLTFGGFGEWQHLKGGEKSDVLWPDNDLNIYGGKIGLKYSF